MSEQPTPSTLILQMGKLRLEQEGPDPKPPSQLPGSQHSGPVLWTPSPVLLALCGLAHTCSLQLDIRALGTSGRGLPVPLPSPRRQKKIVGLEVSERAVFRSSLSRLGTGGCLQLDPEQEKPVLRAAFLPDFDSAMGKSVIRHPGWRGRRHWAEPGDQASCCRVARSLRYLRLSFPPLLPTHPHHNPRVIMSQSLKKKYT